jgi:hypothetical protein
VLDPPDTPKSRSRRRLYRCGIELVTRRNNPGSVQMKNLFEKLSISYDLVNLKQIRGFDPKAGPPGE